MKRTLSDSEGGRNEAEATDDPLRRKPPDKTLDWVAGAVGPGSHVLSVRRLTEGHWHANHVVTVADGEGAERELVLRRWARREWRSEDPDFTPEREATVLELVADASVPTPQLVAVDTDGAVCDVPALLTNCLPGHPPDAPPDVTAFVQQLAEALGSIHVASRAAKQRLPRYRRYYSPNAVQPPGWSDRPELWERALDIVSGPVPAGRECLIHRDYHPGNTLWLNEQLTGVVDWTTGSWGPAAVDTAHMRWNLAVGYSLEAAEKFLEHYRSLAPDSESDQHYWDLVTVVDVLPDLDPKNQPRGWDHRLETYVEGSIAKLKGGAH